MKHPITSRLMALSERPSMLVGLSTFFLLFHGCASSGAKQQAGSQVAAQAQQNRAEQGNQASDNLAGNQLANNNSSQTENAAGVNGGASDNFTADVGNPDNSAGINNVVPTDSSPLKTDVSSDLGDLPPTNTAASSPSPLNVSSPMMQQNTANALTANGLPMAQPTKVAPQNGAPPLNATTANSPQGSAEATQVISHPEGVLSWVGYNYNKISKRVEVQIVTSGSPHYRIFREVNRGGQSELVVRFLNTKVRRKIRRDIDATEFRSPVAYVRMRHDNNFAHTDVVMTLRESSQPVVTTKGSSLMFAFDIGEHWFAPSAIEKPVASAQIIKEDSQSLTPGGDSLPGEASKEKAAAYVNDPGKDTFSGKNDLNAVPLVPKEESGTEMIPVDAPSETPGQEMLKNEILEDVYFVKSVAQADFSSDIPASGDFSPNSLLEDVATNTATGEAMTPTATVPAANGDLVGVTPGSAASAAPSQKKALRLDFRDAPISQIIRMIASESQINFIIAPEVGSKKTTISMKNVPWDVALKALLESNRLGMQEISPGLVRIDALKTFADDREAEERARQANEALIPTKILVMPLNYAKAEDAVKLVQTILPKPTDQANIAQKRNYDRFKAQADTRSNSVIVEATPNVIATVKTLLERLDSQTPQVRIAVRLVEVSSTISDGLGLNWNAPFSFDPGRGLGFGSLPFPNYMSSEFAVDPGGAATTAGTAAFKFGSINNLFALDLKLRMFETRRMAETLHTQDIFVQDNETAKIAGGRTDFFLTAGGKDTPGTLAEVSYNLSLDVKPHITADGAVQMKLDIKGDSPAPSIPAQAQASKSNRQLTTTLLKRSGETAVIGGLYASEVSKIERGIPFFSKLPIIGALFRSTDHNDDKKDLLVMVTPTIVGMSNASGGGQAGANIQEPISAPTAMNAVTPNSQGAANNNPKTEGSQQQQNQGSNAASQNGLMQNGESSNASFQSNDLE